MSQIKTTSTKSHQNFFVLYTFCSGVVIGIYIVPLICKSLQVKATH
ncbi:MAG: hypothetical protein U9Q66_00210 [Patescibacteria group bacterium]|nr:hypothetical protein [Patescibacteria group bacterium]